MTAYYNENDPFAAAWLRELIKAGAIAPGEVDERSIVDIKPSDLAGFTQCHFFAGIGGWSYALRLAGWPDDRPVWTGSCPCQPFSDAGLRKGTEDSRHLWPELSRLISIRKPATVFGEQTASRLGREWLSGVRLDLETMGYAVGCADLCAASKSAPHIRQRLYWVADAHSKRWQNSERRAGQAWQAGRSEPFTSDFEGVGDSASEQVRQCRQPWELSEAIECVDGWRRIEPELQPLAYGIPSGVVQKRGYGNAVVPQVAAEVIAAYLSCQHT